MQKPELNIISQVDQAAKKVVSKNNGKAGPNSVQHFLFCCCCCCTHDIALRGKDSTTVNLRGLFDFRIESGDKVLKEHMEGANRNAQYNIPTSLEQANRHRRRGVEISHCDICKHSNVTVTVVFCYC